MRPKSIVTCSSALPITFALIVAPLASATAPRVEGGVVHACMKTKGKKKQVGSIRIVASAKQCKRKKGEKPLTWSLLGPAGSDGTQGATGTQGAAGPTGKAGTAGAAGAVGEQGVRGEKGSAATVENELHSKGVTC